jgi:hypothetical protein
MIARLFVTIVLVCYYVDSLGQDDRKIEPGIMAGFTISYFSKAVDEAAQPGSEWKKSFRLSGAFGLHTRIRLTDVLAVRAEMYYISKGGAYYSPAYGVTAVSAQGSTTAEYQRIYKLGYIEIPALLQGHLSRDTDEYPFLMVGPSIGFNVASALKRNDYNSVGGSPVVDESYTSEPFPHAKSVLPSAVVGFGFRDEWKIFMLR